jgi:hypothetical protein
MKDVQGAAGYHQDKNGQPYSVVEYGNKWSITASHECLEMLADPFGRRLKSGNLPDQAVKLGVKQGRVRYLVEVCDPSESGQFGYHVNGILVSDFYTPHFFDPVASPGIRYSFTGKIDAPRKILKDGYISWQDLTSKHWFQLRMFPDESSSKIPHVIDLTNDTAFEKLKVSESLRGAIDRVTPSPQYAAVMTAPATSFMSLDRYRSIPRPAKSSAVKSKNKQPACSTTCARSWNPPAPAWRMSSRRRFTCRTSACLRALTRCIPAISPILNRRAPLWGANYPDSTLRLM